MVNSEVAALYRRRKRLAPLLSSRNGVLVVACRGSTCHHLAAARHVRREVGADTFTGQLKSVGVVRLKRG